MSKIVKEDCRELSIYKLKQWGILRRYWQAGQITWTSQSSQHKNSISYVWSDNKKLIELDYKITRPGDKKPKEIHQEIKLELQPCFYGGHRFFFRCPVYKSGQYCGKRVAKLYLAPWNNYFACRHCYGLTYRSRVDGWTYYFGDEDDYAKNIKRWYYAGNLTKKHMRYRKISTALHISLLKMMTRFERKNSQRRQ